MKEIRIVLEDDEHKKLVKKKGSLSWKDVLLMFLKR